MSNTNIGDINSTAIGSGARFNAGKPAVELLPISELARYYHIMEGGTDQAPSPLVHTLYKLGQFQEGGDERCLFDIIHLLGGEDAILESAHVFTYGAKKYVAHNWMKGMAWSVPLGCAVRHVLAQLRREVIDQESGREHRGHVLCNIWMLILYTRTYKQGDDRPPRELFAGTVYGAPPSAATIPAGESWPLIERRAPRPKDAELMLEAARALSDFGVHLQGDDAPANAANYKTWTPDACWALKSRLRTAAREGSE